MHSVAWVCRAPLAPGGEHVVVCARTADISLSLCGLVSPEEAAMSLTLADTFFTGLLVRLPASLLSLHWLQTGGSIGRPNLIVS